MSRKESRYSNGRRHLVLTAHWPLLHSSELLAQYKESLETLSLDRFIAQKDLPRSVYVRELRAPTASSGTQTEGNIADGENDLHNTKNQKGIGEQKDGDDALGEDDFYYSDDGSVSGDISDSDLAEELCSPWRVAEEFGTGRKYYWNTVTRETRWQIPDRDDPTYIKLVVAAAYRRGQRSNENEIASMQAKVATLQDMILGSSSLSEEERSNLVRRVASDMTFFSMRRSRRSSSTARSRNRSRSRDGQPNRGGKRELGGILDISKGAKDGEVVFGGSSSPSRHLSTSSNASSIPPPLPGEAGTTALSGLGQGGAESAASQTQMRENGKSASRLSRVDLGNVIGEGDDDDEAGEGDGGSAIFSEKQRSGTVVIDQSVPREQSSFVGSSAAALRKTRGRILSVDVKEEEWDSSEDERPKERDLAKLQAEAAAAEEELEKDREQRQFIAAKKQYGGKEEVTKSKHMRKGSAFRKSRSATMRGKALEGVNGGEAPPAEEGPPPPPPAPTQPPESPEERAIREKAERVERMRAKAENRQKAMQRARKRSLAGKSRWKPQQHTKKPSAPPPEVVARRFSVEPPPGIPVRKKSMTDSDKADEERRVKTDFRTALLSRRVTYEDFEDED